MQDFGRASRRPRLPSVMVLASAAIASNGRSANRTAAATSTALTSRAARPVINNTRRRVCRASVTRATSMARVSWAPSTRVGALSVIVVLLIPGPAGGSLPNSAPFRSTR